jgi:hypothetical protein
MGGNVDEIRAARQLVLGADAVIGPFGKSFVGGVLDVGAWYATFISDPVARICADLAALSGSIGELSVEDALQRGLVSGNVCCESILSCQDDMDRSRLGFPRLAEAAIAAVESDFVFVGRADQAESDLREFSLAAGIDVGALRSGPSPDVCIRNEPSSAMLDAITHFAAADIALWNHLLGSGCPYLRPERVRELSLFNAPQSLKVGQ